MQTNVHITGSCYLQEHGLSDGEVQWEKKKKRKREDASEVEASHVGIWGGKKISEPNK